MKKEFHAALVTPLSNGGYAPVDGNLVLSLASQAMSAITAKHGGQRAWAIPAIIREHPDMRDPPAWLLEKRFFEASAHYRVGPHTETLRMVCGTEIHVVQPGFDHRTLLFVAYEDSFLWQFPDAEGLVAVTMNNISALLDAEFGELTWYMVEGNWRFTNSFARRCHVRSG